MTTKHIGLLVGAGSIGKRHARLMSERFDRLVVVDPSETSRDWITSNLGGHVHVVPTLDDGLHAVGTTSTIAVVATIGPMHFVQVEELINSGIRHIYCEKPLATSIADGHSIADLAARSGTRLTVGIQRRFNGLAEQIRRFATANLGGLPVSLVGHGGAHCLITTGMHWVDLAIDVFGEFPLSVSGMGKADLINPRGADLEFWQGTTAWTFSSGRMLSLTYSNQTSVDGYLHIYCPQGRIDIGPDGSVRGYRRDRREVELDSRVTRTGDVHELTEPVFVAPSTHPFIFALEELESDLPLRYSASDAARSLECTLAALVSIETGRTTQLPIDKSDTYYRRTWAVT